jgi:TRAP-type C4-dicarboxylate transport system permease small subunit
MYANLEEYVSAFLVGLMILCLMLQVGVRIVIGAGLAWTEELSRFCFIWAVYVGASLAAKRAAHVRISAQFLLAPVKVRLFFRIVADSIWIGFNIFFVFLTIDMTREAFAFPEVSPTLGWVKAWIEMIIPISFAMMTLRTVEVYITHWRAGTLASMVDFVEEAQK